MNTFYKKNNEQLEDRIKIRWKSILKKDCVKPNIRGQIQRKLIIIPSGRTSRKTNGWQHNIRWIKISLDGDIQYKNDACIWLSKIWMKVFIIEY